MAVVVSKKGDPRLSRDYKRVRQQVLARDGFVCFYCGQDATTVDHIIPIIKGGDPIALENMVAACRSCNSAKGSRSEGLFLQRRATPPVFSDHLSLSQSEPMLDSPFKIRPNPSQ